jgi:hypothetical protein
VINRSNLPYVILRGYDELINNEPIKDIDFLAEDFRKFARIINLVPNKYKPYKGHIFLQGQKISIDIRFIGDGYYDSLWQKNILLNRKFISFISVPSPIDYFFSLLYHVLVHKNGKSHKYDSELETIYQSLPIYGKDVYTDSLDWKLTLMINFFKANHYMQTKPLDPSVFLDSNKLVIKKIDHRLNINTIPSIHLYVKQHLYNFKKRLLIFKKALK